MDAAKTLVLSVPIQQDMLDLPDKAAAEADEFILRLAANPYSPEILAGGEDCGGGLRSWLLPSGCRVFWQVLSQPPFTHRPQSGLFVRQTVRIVGVEFEPWR